MTLDNSAAPSWLKLLRDRPALRSFIVIRVAGALGSQILSVAIGWYVYAATHDPMNLAYVGLTRFLPTVGMVLISGQAADRFDRRKIIGLTLLVQAIAIAGFGVLMALGTRTLAPLYLLLFVIGCAQAFAFPALQALLPQLVKAEEFPRAVATASSLFQICTLAGPAIGGMAYALSPPGAFAFAAALFVISLLQMRTLLRFPLEIQAGDDRPLDKSILGGIRYVRSNRILLGAISLDLFAVLFGGATALLPIYARDILVVGPIGLGWLRCAPGIGASLVGVALAHRTVARGAGKLMFACVAGFGVATIVFAVSRNFWLSLFALAVLGGFDMVSMVIRQTLVQIATPDAMRGRVSAVNGLFIGASNELGEFESGATAALFGTEPATVIGGVGTLAVVGLWSWLFPELRRADSLGGEGDPEMRPAEAVEASPIT